MEWMPCHDLILFLFFLTTRFSGFQWAGEWGEVEQSWGEWCKLYNQGGMGGMEGEALTSEFKKIIYLSFCQSFLHTPTTTTTHIRSTANPAWTLLFGNTVKNSCASTTYDIYKTVTRQVSAHAIFRPSDGEWQSGLHLLAQTLSLSGPKLSGGAPSWKSLATMPTVRRLLLCWPMSKHMAAKMKHKQAYTLGNSTEWTRFLDCKKYPV